MTDGHWDIENPDRVDGGENQIYICNEIETALPGKIFRMCCVASEAKFVFDEALTSEEETTLTDTVNAHQTNT